MIGTGYIYALIIILGFFGIIFLLDKLNLLEPYGFEISGPMLMWSTKRGRSLIDKVAQKRRFWKIFGTIGIIIVAIAMVLMFSLMAFQATIVGEIEAEEAPGAIEVLVIPGVNPFIPIGYGILALAVGIIIHEFSHGILTRVADVDVKSLGLIFLVVPLGAFCEPDEDQIEETERIKRDRMFAAGPTSNILIAIVLFLIFSTFFMGSVSPEEDSLLVMEIYEDTPADDAGIQTFDHILEIDGEPVSDLESLNNIDVPLVEENGSRLREVNITARRGEERITYENVKPGLVFLLIEDGYPVSEQTEIEIGDIVTHVDGKGINRTEVRNRTAFNDVMEEKEKTDTLNLTYWERDNSEYKRNTTSVELTRDKLGISTNYLGFGFNEADWYPQMLSNPISSADSSMEAFQNAAMYISLPLLRLSPVPEEMTGFYEIEGPLSILPSSSFWLLTNTIYWVFWINILLGLFNALPLYPLDGGRLVKDWFGSLTERLGFSEKNQEKISTGVATGLSLLVVFFIIWTMVGPRIL